MTAPIPEYILYTAALIVSVVVSLYAVRKIIFITSHRRIFDIPDNVRKIHGSQVPSLGGIGIFAGYMIASAFFMYLEWYYVVAASVILFFTGIYDDIMNMRPSKKLVAQLLAAAVTVFLADIRISSLYGIGGIWELPYAVSALLTMLCCTFFINVFNFMDGIDGLACVLAIIYTGTFGVLFAGLGDENMAGISLSLMGATIGLLYYNIAPARIYMGDTGSMMLGLTIFTFSVSVINTYSSGQNTQLLSVIHSTPAIMMIALSVVFLPVYDAVRVFIVRISRGISPLRADRSHVHYYLLDAGCTHTGAVLAIAIANIVIVVTTWLLQDIHPLLLLLTMSLLTSCMMYLLYLARQKALKK